MEFVVISSKPGNQKTAICFSGQLRTWRNCIETYRNIILPDADIFCHIWDYNTSPNWITDNKNPDIINNTEIQDIIEILKPKKYMIENYRPMKPINSNQLITYHGYLSQFYGIMRAAKLKKEYEIEHDLQYDVVARARYDSFFISKIIDYYKAVKSKTIHGFHFGWDTSKNIGRMGDIYWFAESRTYDVISDFYLNIASIDPDKTFYTSDMPPEFLFFHYLKKNHILIENNYWDIKVFRKNIDESFSKSKTGFEIW